ncbi:hypothetical protein B0H19DRAFT_717306 [Mycena capillaripes]|nr:hypothetical protein B0H19DRAFT_717306 [Mycena capillaripes]
MPRMSGKVTEVLHYTEAAAATLRDIASSTNVPFLATIAALSIAVVPLVQGMKTNKDRCTRMVEQVHELLCTLAALVLDSENLLSPKLLDQIGGLSQTLQKFYACLRSQQEISRIKRFFTQVDLTFQLDTCQAELNTALHVFKMRSGADVSAQAATMEMDLEQRHQELLDIIKGRQNTDFSDTASSTRGPFLDMNNSSGTLPLLPPLPQIFHGRDRELQETVLGLLSDPARVAILGMGGIGKTTLAAAALHDSRVVEKYPHRYFLSCESVRDATGLINLLGSHLGIEPSASLKQLITKYFSESGPSILVLDNLETPWELLSTRPNVEEFLSHLSSVPHLALLVTMRGAERPAKVKWTRPFLVPLEPLSLLAARQTFVAIADDPEGEEEEALAELLEHTGHDGHLPLAVTLMANIASFEGCSRALARWKTESTSLLSEGEEKSSNLDVSIRVSLSSPRLASSPHAIDLLSLISLLPDGISEDDLLASKVPIFGIPACRSSLLRTSLVYTGHDGRIKSLSPIRGYIQRFRPPSHSLTDPLRRYFHDLVSVWFSHQELSKGTLVPRLTSHLGNIHSLVLDGLRPSREASVLSEIGNTILTLNKFCHLMLKGTSSLMSQVPGIIEFTNDMQLHWRYTEARIRGMGAPLAAPEAENLIREGIEYFTAENNTEGQVDYYNLAVTYYMRIWDLPKAREYSALELEHSTNGDIHQLRACRSRATIGNLTGDHLDGLKYSAKVVQLARLVGSVPDECNGLMDAAMGWCNLGELRQAQGICGQVRQIMDVCGLGGSTREIAVLDMEAEIHFQKSEYADARDLHTIVQRMTSEDIMPYFHANTLIAKADVCILAGATEIEIRTMLDKAKQLTDKLGWTSRKIMCEEIFALLSLHQGEIEAARATLKSCFSKNGTEDTETAYISLQYLGDLSYGMCDVDETLRWAGIYFALARKSKAMGHTYQALRCLGDVLLAQGDETSALDVFRAVLVGSTEMDVHRRRADCLVRIADILGRTGDLETAREMWGSARPLFARSSQAKQVAAMTERLALVV